MSGINILPTDLPMVMTEGNRVPPHSFRIVDANGDDITAYTVTMVFAPKAGAGSVLTLSENSGLKKQGAVFSFDFTVSLAPRTYRHYIHLVLTSNTWAFTVFAGQATVFKKGEKSGNISAVTERICKLPVVPVVQPGGGIGYMMVGSTFTVQ